MRLSAHHARYFAHELTRKRGPGLDRLSMSLFDAAVDFFPHQSEAALFALESPRCQGVVPRIKKVIRLESCEFALNKRDLRNRRKFEGEGG